MNVGNNIKSFRIKKGYSQKQLGDKLYVTAQAVSRWELGEIEPNLDILHKMCEIFGCKIDELIYGVHPVICEKCGKDISSEDPSHKVKRKTKDGEETIVIFCDDCYQQLLASKKNDSPAPQSDAGVVATPITQTVVIHQKEMHVCERCKRDIPEDELDTEAITVVPRSKGHSAITRLGYYHKDCLKELRKEKAAIEKAKRDQKAKRAKKMSFGWGIAGGSVAFALVLIFLLLAHAAHPGLVVLFALLSGYGIFAMLYCIITGSYIGDIFEWCAGLSIRFPGLIFSWSIDGFIWVITMKILFAVLGFLIGVLALLLAIVISAVFSFFSFPFVLIHNIHTNYEDAL